MVHAELDGGLTKTAAARRLNTTPKTCAYTALTLTPCVEDFGPLPAQSVKVVQTRPPPRFRLLRGFLTGARLLGLQRVAKWILPARAYERRVTQLWRNAGDDPLWRTVTIVLPGPFKQPSQVLKAKEELPVDSTSKQQQLAGPLPLGTVLPSHG